MEEADALCDRVALMHLGTIRAQGTPAELKAHLGAGACIMPWPEKPLATWKFSMRPVQLPITGLPSSSFCS